MLESYITPLVLSYVDKYVKNLKPSDLQLLFWGGDAVLKNFELRLDVLEKELGYPLEFKSGRVQDLNGRKGCKELRKLVDRAIFTTLATCN